MCNVYIKTDPIHYQPRSHSVRIHGVVTTIRLENEFWTMLAAMAASEGRTTNELIATLYDEVTKFRGEIHNFASFLRVCCIRYMQMKDHQAGAATQPAQNSLAAVQSMVRRAN